VNGLEGAPDGSLDKANAAGGGNVQGIAHLIFIQYVIAFEVTAVLLIIAAFGAMLLAHRERHTPKASQADMSKARLLRFSAGGPLPGNTPPAGTYARHNAVDTPALLPDGSVAPESIPTPLTDRGAVRSVPKEAPTEAKEVFEGHAVALGQQEGTGDGGEPR
jgi:NADH-quinone oxidoreductase subunit J